MLINRGRSRATMTWTNFSRCRCPLLAKKSKRHPGNCPGWRFFRECVDAVLNLFLQNTYRRSSSLICFAFQSVWSSIGLVWMREVVFFLSVRYRITKKTRHRHNDNGEFLVAAEADIKKSNSTKIDMTSQLVSPYVLRIWNRST